MKPQEIREEIERLQKQLSETRREFKVKVTFYIDACNYDEIDSVMAKVASTIGNLDGEDVSYDYEETGK